MLGVVLIRLFTVDLLVLLYIFEINYIEDFYNKQKGVESQYTRVHSHRNFEQWNLSFLFAFFFFICNSVYPWWERIWFISFTLLFSYSFSLNFTAAVTTRSKSNSSFFFFLWRLSKHARKHWKCAIGNWMKKKWKEGKAIKMLKGKFGAPNTGGNEHRVRSRVE